MVHFPGKNGENGGRINIFEGKVPLIHGNLVHFPGKDGRGMQAEWPQKRLSYFIPGESAADSWKFGSLSPIGRTKNAGRMTAEAIA